MSKYKESELLCGMVKRTMEDYYEIVDIPVANQWSTF